MSGIPQGLARYETARRALAEARSVDEVKDIRDKAAALQAYAWQAKNRDLEADAGEIRIRAERRVGEMMAEQPKATGGERGGKTQLDGFRKNPSNPTATLAEAGIDKNLANRARKLASMPKREFETKIADWKQEQHKTAAKINADILKPAHMPKVPKPKPQKAEPKSDKVQAMVEPDVRDELARRAEKEGIGEPEYLRRLIKTDCFEPKIDEATLSPSVQEKVKTWKRQQLRKMEAEFESRVQAECQKRIEDTILPHYNKTYAEYQVVLKARKGIMDRATYRKIWSCLHPDRVAQEPELIDKYKEAFYLFSKLEVVLLDEKERPSSDVGMPQTYADLMELKRKVKERRRRGNQEEGIAVRI